MNPFDALGGFAVSLVKNHELQNWIKLAASLVISGIVTALATFSGSLFLLYSQHYSPIWAVILSVGAASGMTAGVLIYLWKSNPATKGIPFAFPSDAEMQALTKGITYDPNKQK